MRRLLEIRKRNVNAFWLYFQQGVIAASSLTIAGLSYAGMGLSEYGFFTLVVAVSSIILNVVGVQAAEAVTYFCLNERKNFYSFSRFKIITCGFVVDFGILFLYGLAVALLIPLLGSYYFEDPRYKNCILLSSVWAALVLTRATPNAVFSAEFSQHIYAKINIVEHAIRCFLVFLLYSANQLKIEHLFFTYILCSVLATSVTYVVFVRAVEGFRLSMASRSHWKLFSTYAIKTFSSSFLKSGYQRIDLLVAGAFLSVNYIGAYDVFKKILNVGVLITNPLAQIFAPNFIVYVRKQDWKILDKTVFYSTTFVWLFMTVYIGLIFLVGPKIELYTDIRAVIGVELMLVLWGVISVKACLWWPRIFSNATDPIYSFYASGLAMASMCTLLPLLTYYYSDAGFIYGQMLTVAILLMFWIYCYYAVKHKEIVKQ